MKKYLLATVGIVVIVSVIGGIKWVQISTLLALPMQMPPTSISTVDVEEQNWEMTLSSVGTVEAVQGVIVTADIPGRVEEILFTPGAEVKAGDILLQQDVSSEQAQLRAAESGVALAKANLDRVETLRAKNVSSQSEYDTAVARYKESVAQADNIRTIIEKKSVKAPFAGRLGIRLVNVGSELSVSEPIVSLQTQGPVFVNFSLPQRVFASLKPGLEVRVETDASAGVIFGTITAINPQVDASTRNIRVQATLQNASQQLLPGMFATVELVLPEVKTVLAIPITAVAYATYGDSIYKVVSESGEDGASDKQIAKQSFVRLGESRGDFVAVEEGVEPGEVIVSTGVFKLHNGAAISVNNETQPDFSLDPAPGDS